MQQGCILTVTNDRWDERLCNEKPTPEELLEGSNGDFENSLWSYATNLTSIKATILLSMLVWVRCLSLEESGIG
jgi:hypothetical protein